MFRSIQAALEDIEALRLLCDSCMDLPDFPAFLFTFFVAHGKILFLLDWAIEREVKANICKYSINTCKYRMMEDGHVYG